MMGRNSDSGVPKAAPKIPNDSSLSGTKAMTATAARTEMIRLVATSQKPDRVSNILRSSTVTSRLNGTPGRWVWIVTGDVAALMRHLRW